MYDFIFGVYTAVTFYTVVALLFGEVRAGTLMITDSRLLKWGFSVVLTLAWIFIVLERYTNL